MQDLPRHIELADDTSWSSTGLGSKEALKHWQAWTCEAMAPIDIHVPDEGNFAAHVRNYSVGPLNLATFTATAQRVLHMADMNAGWNDYFQLVYSCRTPLQTRVGARYFLVQEGQFVLIDNAQSYEMNIENTHEAIALLMPRSWLENWLPDPGQCTARPICASSDWGRPLGCFMSTTAQHIEDAALPRSMLADQIGALLALAVGRQPAVASTHKMKFVQRLLKIIGERYSDPELCPEDVARELGISKRYLHALLADSGTTFIASLNQIRLGRASARLADKRLARTQISEIAWQCGYLDPSYFARIFRRNFGKSPAEWRKERCQ